MTASGGGRRRARSALGIAIQVIGFGIGVALFVWIVRRAGAALTPEKIEELRAAPAWMVGLIVALAALSITLNGVMWWSAIRPVRRVPLQDCVWVNGVATALALLPFKLSVVYRLVIHTRRHRVAILTFGGWGAALGAILVASLAPAIGASLLLEGGGPAWWGVSVGGAIGLLAMLAVLARFFSTGAGWRWLRSLVVKICGARGERVMDSQPMANVHAGVFMLASPAWTMVGGGLRMVDASAIGARFWLAAEVLGVEINAGEAAVVGVSYFLISVFAPTGAVGVREAGAAELFERLGVADALLAVAFVGVIELLVSVLFGGLGALAMHAVPVAWGGRAGAAEPGDSADPRGVGSGLRSPADFMDRGGRHADNQR